MAAASRQPAYNAAANSSHAPTETWIEIIQGVFDALRIPALDPKLWGRTWELVKLKDDVLTINPGDEQIIEERLLHFFDQHGGEFYCRIPINDPVTGESYCNQKLGRKYRILGHLRAHLNFRPFVCGGDCGIPGCQERFCEERYREKHINPDKRKCDYCQGFLYRQNLASHLKSCEKNPMRTVA